MEGGATRQVPMPVIVVCGISAIVPVQEQFPGANVFDKARRCVLH